MCGIPDTERDKTSPLAPQGIWMVRALGKEKERSSDADRTSNRCFSGSSMGGSFYRTAARDGVRR